MYVCFDYIYTECYRFKILIMSFIGMVSRNSNISKIPQLNDDTKPSLEKSLVNEYIQSTTLHGVCHLSKGNPTSMRYCFNKDSNNYFRVELNIVTQIPN